jgi:IMP dehydrogenase
MRILESKSVYYDDVNLIARPTTLASRKDVIDERWRVVVSPMQSIVGSIFAKKALDLGISVCLHRFDSTIEKRISLLKEVKQTHNENLWVAVEMKSMDNALRLIEAGAKNIIIDVANGYMMGILDYVKNLVDAANPAIQKIMVGNIHTSSMLPYYLQLAKAIGKPVYYRCGIASGSACNTKGMTGYNRGQITEIAECAEFSRHYPELVLVADGGIKDPSCVVKAFGAGAEMVMMGGYFSRAKESNHVINEIYKFWGGASEFQQILSNGRATRHSEGKELSVDKDSLESLEVLVYNLCGAIQSGVSYSGYHSLSEFIGNGIFEQIA